jgi:hypothetical protein
VHVAQNKSTYRRFQDDEDGLHSWRVQGSEAARQAFSDAQYDLFIVDVCRYRREGIVAATQY